MRRAGCAPNCSCCAASRGCSPTARCHRSLPPTCATTPTRTGVRSQRPVGLVLALAFALVACGTQASPGESQMQEPAQTALPTFSPSHAPTVAPETSPVETPAATPAVTAYTV